MKGFPQLVVPFVLAVALVPGQAAAGSLEEGLKAVAAKDWPAALAHLEAALAADPGALRPASEYRQAVIAAGEYDRAIAFFEKLVADHPRSANAWLNFGYAYVDKIPAAGSITQVILANTALGHFSTSIGLEKTWLNLFTRGNSYLYWPKIFGRAPLAVADLEQAVAISKAEPKRPYQARAWIALGDAYLKTDDPAKARATWEEARKLFPEDRELAARLARQGEELEAYLHEQLDPNKRVDTDLSIMWEAP